MLTPLSTSAQALMDYSKLIYDFSSVPTERVTFWGLPV
jgi:hypothetical protein